MNKFILIVLLTMALPLCLRANPYAKMGSDPSLGVGMRGSHGHHGYDLSGNSSFKKYENDYSGKGLYLFYPQPEKQNRPYVGAGVGAHHRTQSVPLQTRNFSNSELSKEAVVGYEFRHNDQMKLYTQLELSQVARNSPGLQLSIGFGF